MEIRMVKCPKCGTVYNEAVSVSCPQCTGTGSQSMGFGKTTGPNAGHNSHNNFANHIGAMSTPTGGGFGPAGVHSGGAFPSTGAPSGGGFAPTGAPSGGGFTPTMPPNGGNAGTLSGSFFPSTKPPADGRFVHTQFVGQNATTKDKLRVTGWLVVLGGNDCGTDMRIHAGYNYIGKEQGDIRISDPFVSREKDSQIYCDEENGKFYIAHVNGVNAVKVNNVPVISGAQELHPYDILTVGKTNLVFVPLCSAQFRWEDYV